MNRLLLAITTVAALLTVTSCGEKPLTLQQYEKALATAGLRTGDKESKIAAVIGAKNGYGFSYEDDSRCAEDNPCYCEVYEFDTSIESGREAMATLKKEGFWGQKFEFNKNLGIFCPGDSSQDQKAVSVLMKM